MTTLVISDLHLGSRLGRDVLRRPEALEALLAALDGVERLVLLGDVVELLEGRPREAMDVAEPVLRSLGTQLGSAAEVIVVPGNHDAAFVRPWVRARDGSLGLDTPIPLDATPALARLTSWLGPARVRPSSSSTTSPRRTSRSMPSSAPSSASSASGRRRTSRPRREPRCRSEMTSVVTRPRRCHTRRPSAERRSYRLHRGEDRRSARHGRPSRPLFGAPRAPERTDARAVVATVRVSD